MLEILSLLAIGFLFGLRHAFDADHIAAVSVLSSQSRTLKSALQKGIFWGLGHTVTLFLLGIIVLTLGLTIPQNFSNFFEKIVGILLLILGIMSFSRKRESRFQTESGMTIAHQHPPMGLHLHPHPSFWVGVVHGLAGSATIFILIVSTVQSILLGLLYILIFGIGSIVGMSILSLGIGSVAIRFKKYTGLATGIFSCAMGIFLFFT